MRRNRRCDRFTLMRSPSLQRELRVDARDARHGARQPPRVEGDHATPSVEPVGITQRLVVGPDIGLSRPGSRPGPPWASRGRTELGAVSATTGRSRFPPAQRYDYCSMTDKALLRM